MPDYCNFGGFVAISTVDLPGRAACAIFLRGCPNRCHWCHNPHLMTGENKYPLDYLKMLIKDAKLAVSAVVFTGGEPTAQPAALRELMRYAKDQGLYTALHTSGVFPEVIAELSAYQVLDHVSLDIKTTWDRYPALLKNSLTPGVMSTLSFCSVAESVGVIDKFEVIHTVFPDSLPLIPEIAQYAPENDLVLQQGNSGFISLDREVLVQAAKSCESFRKNIRIRTKEFGEELIVWP